VLKNIGKIFEKSDGAVILAKEKSGLHNRVFITGEGNPTYEGKEIGLAELQFKENPDLIIHVVASEQQDYFKVVFKAIELLWPQTKGKEFHLVYGFVKLKEGKMSSRRGNVVLGEWLLDEAKKQVFQIMDSGQLKYPKKDRESIAEKVAVAAVKYAFLRVGTRQEIAFSFAESVSLHGESGPYLLYSYARAKSVLRKVRSSMTRVKDLSNLSTENIKLAQEERDLLRLLFFYPEIVAAAAENYAPSTVSTYLFKLAQAFNLFYAKYPILPENAKSEQVAVFRLALTSATAETLQKGLNLLGIDTVEEM
jgi:arginyl-tRNA synthetase